MTITWTNDITNMLWHVTLPLPAFISNNNGIFTLTGYNNITASCHSLLDAQNAYIIALQRAFSQPIQVAAHLFGVTDPEDGDQVAIIKTNGSYAWGTWSTSDQTITVLSQTIPVSDIIGWTIISSPSFLQI